MTNNNNTLLLDVIFPAELQRIVPLEEEGEDDEIKTDNIHIRIIQETVDIYFVTLSSETDVFFHLSNRITRELYDILRREQQLVVNYEDFPNTLKKLLLSCVQERNTNAALLVLEEESANLHIVKKMDHKIVELLSFPFQKLSEMEIRFLVQTKFEEMKTRLEVAEKKLAEYNTMFRAGGKVPSLLHHKQPSLQQHHSSSSGSNNSGSVRGTGKYPPH